MEKLRDEILQAESARSDLLKWKLGLVGTIGAAGLGFAGFYRSGQGHHPDLVLAVLPLVAIYVDLLCLHLTLRILVIGSFLATPQARAAESAEVHREYEKFARLARELADSPPKTKAVSTKSAFDLEDWALRYSTWGLSVLVGLYGVIRLSQSSPLGLIFLISGGVGLLATLVGQREYADRCRRVVALNPGRAERA
jgi:hypothetical protein